MSEFQTIYEVLSLICLILLNVVEIYKYYLKHKSKDDNQTKLKEPFKEPLTIQNIQQNQLEPIGAQYNPNPKNKDQNFSNQFQPNTNDIPPINHSPPTPYSFGNFKQF